MVDNDAAVFVPRRELPRTPPRVKQELSAEGNRVRVERGPGRNKNISVTPSSSGVKDRENIPPEWLSPSNHRKVQALCFTPRKSLARSPPPTGQLTVTPKATHSTLLASPLQPHRPGDISPLPAAVPTNSQPPQPSSTSTHRGSGVGMGLPEGLLCTDTDLAFLQRMKNIRYHDQLQKQVVSLDKALRTAAEQKEQLQHQAEKVNNDLQGMKHKHTRTLRQIQCLQFTSEPQESAGEPTSTSDDRDVLATELSHTHISQLQHRRTLLTAQLQKTGQDIETEVSKINQKKQKLYDTRRKERSSVEELDRELQAVQEDKRQWEVKVQNTTEAHHKMERELQLLQSELELTAPPATRQSSSQGDSSATVEKKAEERLRLLVKRCDLYVKRHHLLKQLRQTQT